MEVTPIFGSMGSDAVPNRTPENSFTYALNQVVRENSIVTEYGFSSSAELDDGFIEVSSYYISNNRQVIFATNGIISTIGIFNGSIYVEHVRANLNFSLNYFIDCTYRLKNGCEDVIYFTDGLNPVRYFNFTRTDNFKTNGNWDINKFSLTRTYKVPQFKNIQVKNSSGLIKAGSVIFGIDYLDNDLNATHVIDTTSPVILYKGLAQNPIGTYNDEPVAKSVEFNIFNLDVDFKFYRIYVCYIDNKTGRILNVRRTYPINVTQDKFIFNNLQPLEDVSITDVISFKANIEKAKYIEQIDNQLILGNTKSETIDAAAHQKLASKIGVGAVIKSVKKDAYTDKHHPNNPNYLEFASHMADEVIALGITFINTETGKESGPYHIPGRPMDSNPYDCSKDGIGIDATLYTYKCIKFIITTIKPNNVVPEVLITFDEYKNGNLIEENATVVLNIYGDGEQIEHEICGSTETSFVVKSLKFARTGVTFPESLYLIQYYNKVVNNNPYTKTLDGWDSTVDLNNNRDVTAIQNLNIPELNAYIAEFFGGPPGQTVERLTNAEFLKFIKGKILSGEFDYPLKWEVYNTAKLVEGNNIIMGYHENKQSYYEHPLNSNCIDDYWGVDICGNVLTNTKIRHHRLPDRKFINVSNATHLNLLGLTFFNIEYPEGYNAHYFSCGIKTESDKTVLDNGICTRQVSADFITVNGTRTRVYTKGSAYLYNHYARNPDLRAPDLGFYSPASLLNINTSQGYLKLNYVYADLQGSDDNPQWTEQGRLNYNEAAKLTGADDLTVGWCKIKLGIPQVQPAITNLPIKRSYNIPPLGTELDGEFEIRNLSNANRLIYFAETERDINNLMGYCSVKIRKDVYSHLDLIAYRKLHNSYLTINEPQVVFGGDTYICKFNLVNYAMAEFDASDIGQILTAYSAYLQIAVTAGTAIATGGASLATNPEGAVGSVLAGIGATESIMEQRLTEALTNRLGFITNHDLLKFITDGGDGVVGYIMEILDDVYIDSYINWDLRVDGNDDCLKVLRLTTQQAINRHVRAKFLVAAKTEEEKDNRGDEGLIMRPIICPEFYSVNKDFSPILYAKQYYPIPSSYNHCSNCKEEFALRVHYSLQSFQEELTDNYRVFLPNNYKDVSGEFGPITAVIKNNNSLFIATREALLEQPRNFQERITDQIVSFIGTGSYFEFPTREVASSTFGRIGNINKSSTLNIPEGIMLIDLVHLKIWLVSGKSIENLTGEKYMYKEWFERNMQIQLFNYFDELNIDSSNYCGYITTFDEVDKRIIITKKDYVPKLDTIEFRDDNFYNDDVIVHLTDSEYFYNNSFTISFSFIINGWASFHSYIPNTYLYMKNELYCSLNNKIYKFHNKTTRAKYFDIQYPCIIEFTINNQLTKTLYNNIIISSKAELYDISTSTFKYIHNAGYDQILIYNDRQCSGYINLYDTNENNTIGVKKSMDNDIIHLFRDLVTDTSVPLFIEGNDVDYRYTNKLLNPECITTEKDWYDKSYFKSKTLQIRLILNTFDGVKIYTDLAVLNSLAHTKF